MTLSKHDKLYTKDAAEYLRVSYRTFVDWVSCGRGPTPSGKMRKRDSPTQYGRFWYPADLDAWIASRPDAPIRHEGWNAPNVRPVVNLSDLMSRALAAPTVTPDRAGADDSAGVATPEMQSDGTCLELD